MKMWFFAAAVVVLLAAFVIVPSVQAFDKGKLDDRSTQQEKFRVTLEQLKAEVAAEGGAYTVGYNPAVQYSIDQLCSLNPNLPYSTQYMTHMLDNTVAQPEALPAAYMGYYSSIKDQGSCGSCWAFGAVGLLECMIVKATGVDTVDLSEQYMLSCNPYGWDCNGGFWPNDMLVNPGAALESCSPYVASMVPCNTSCATPYHIQSWAFVTQDYVVPPTADIKQAIYTYGAVQAGVYVNTKFQWYTGGTFSGCAKNARYTNHAIILCGWDDAKGAWRLKNSWGTGWGDQGFMWIKYACSRVGEGANYFIY